MHGRPKKNTYMYVYFQCKETDTQMTIHILKRRVCTNKINAKMHERELYIRKETYKRD